MANQVLSEYYLKIKILTEILDTRILVLAFAFKRERLKTSEKVNFR